MSTIRGSASSSPRVIALLTSRRPPSCRTIVATDLGSVSGLGECGLPSGTVGDSMQQPPRVIHMVRIARHDQLPGMTGRVGCRNTERGKEPLLPVGAVVGQRLARPLARDQHPPTRV